MKTREGFVSNSSTSSFICGICGGIEAGMDLCLDECYMWACEDCGSYFHETCTSIPNDLKDEFDEALQSYRYDNMPVKFCPTCNMSVLSNEDELIYYRMTHGYSKEKTRKEILEKYGSYGKFMEAVVEWKESKEKKTSDEN